MIRILLYALLAWFLYKLIFGFFIPVYRTTRQVKKKFREMQEHMQEEQFRQEQYRQQPPPSKSSPRPRNEDYLDFEEIR